ncbi:hypothetical protein PRUPE_2G204100 [Prunus persica]|uniref:Nucleoside phosphorylase domain-containing protein n=1 Tax=Prunus persica TaxID=3760 RepID=A0A251QJX7_PRUPE|nr:hypothetical protein PRUPE_2G204100 [Prunus persica]
MAAKRFAACFLRLVLISLLVAYSFSLPLNWRSLNLIKKVNREGPYIGLITVFPPEETAFFQIGAFKPNQKHPFVDLSGRRFLVGKIHDKKVVYVRCGVGMMNAAAATQQMLDLFDILGIVHFGIAGNANNSLSIGDVTIPQQFSHTGIWDWLGIKLNQCLNSSVCLPQKPQLVVGLRGSTANIFVDNAAYRDFLFQTFRVSSVDMESSAVVMTSLSNGFPVIVIRGLSDLAGGQSGHNSIDTFGSLAAINACKVVVQFIKQLHHDTR